MWKVTTLAVIIFWSAVSIAMPFGQDTLGAAKYQRVDIQTLVPSQGMGHFSNTFGDIVPVIRAEAARGTPFIRLHLSWRDAHNFSPSDFPAIVKEARRLCPVINQYPNTKWYFSGACEHNLGPKAARKLAQLVLAACPQVTYVNTPGVNGATLPEYINEVHGNGSPHSPRYAYSFDGTAAEDSNVEAFKTKFVNAEYFMLWGPRYNGRWESNDNTPRDQRTGWPDVNWIKSLQYLATDKGPTSLPANTTWKSHSENKGNGDHRAEKPVLITPLKTNGIILKAGNEIKGRMQYYGAFTDGRSRYYTSFWGFELGKVSLWAGDKLLGSVNAGFRDGGFR